MTVSLVKRPAPERVIPWATRCSMTAAKRHFTQGGTVLVSTDGAERIIVQPTTTTHNRDSISWDALRAEVSMWHHRYPTQRWYVLLHCAAIGGHHSDDRVTVWHGRPAPLLLCGMHAQSITHGTPEAAARTLGRLTSAADASAQQPARDLFRTLGTDYGTDDARPGHGLGASQTRGNTVKNSESVRTIVRLERLQHSASGNSRFRVHFSDGTSALTRKDSMYVGALPDSLTGPALVKIDGRGTIWDIEPVTDGFVPVESGPVLVTVSWRSGAITRDTVAASDVPAHIAPYVAADTLSSVLSIDIAEISS